MAGCAVDNEVAGAVSRRGMVLLHLAALGAAVAVAWLTRGGDRWNALTIGAISLFTLISGVTYIETNSLRIRVSGSFLGLVLASVVLGGGPAAIIGAAAIPVIWLRTREAPDYLLNNFVTYTWFPLASGVFFHAAVRLLSIGSGSPAYYLLVFASFVLALALNFAGVVGYSCLRDGVRLLDKVTDVLVPVLPAELFSALLAMGAAWATLRTGIIGVALLGLMLVVFQYLVAELLRSKQRGEELQRLATTDGLTGLANRERFRERLEDEIAAATRDRRPFAVMLLDLDSFKEINDTLGHHYGDELLRRLGPRLADCVGAGGLVARLGGDEFALLPDLCTDDAAGLEAAATRVARIVEEPVPIDGMNLGVGASIGIARFPADGRDAHSLLRRADVAMYAAKEARAEVKLYHADHDRHSLGQLNFLSDFRHALEGEQIVVHYQPIIGVGSGRVVAVEALVRWEHPERGLLPAGSFMPAVEQTTMISALTRHVLERALAETAALRRSGHELSVSVNLSVRNLLDARLPRDIGALLARYGVPADALMLEITESMVMTDPQRTLRVIEEICGLGVRLSLDDFGTGYASLAYLRRLPLTELKIDRSFVSPMLENNSDLAIVRSTINLGHDLGLIVIAEGVEDRETLQALDPLGCDLAQGYHISRPLPAHALVEWLVSGPSCAAGARVPRAAAAAAA